MKKISLLALVLGFAATGVIAQETAEVKLPPAPPAPAAAPAATAATDKPDQPTAKKHGKGKKKHHKKKDGDPSAPAPKSP